MNCSAFDTTTLDLAAVLDRVGGDGLLLQEITRIFLDEYPVLLDRMKDAIQAGDAQGLEHSAHSLKGCVSNFGAEAVVSAALELENIGRSSRLEEAPVALAALERRFASLEPALSALMDGEGAR